MNVRLRRGTADDAERCGTICYEAFTTIAEAHHFPPDFPSPDVTIGLLSRMEGIPARKLRASYANQLLPTKSEDAAITFIDHARWSGWRSEVGTPE